MRMPAELYLLYCRLYVFIGLCSLTAGLYMFYVNHLIGKPAYQGLGPIAFILTLFGPVRIANSIWVMRNLRRKQSGTPGR